MRAQFTLTSGESKRLIAKGVKALPIVKKALAEHTIILAGGTTNAFLAEEILGITIESKSTYTVGNITEGKTGVSDELTRIYPFIISKGKPLGPEIHWKDYLSKLESGDIFIKGGNAVDHTGLAAVAASNLSGGTIGAAAGSLYVRGIELIVPIGLEKLVPDVREAVEFMAGHRPDEAMGDTIGLIPMLGATVVTEITALEALFPVQVKCIAAGGINGSEGAITLVMDGEDSVIKEALKLIYSIKGEPRVK
ncbi:hypothetical protein [Desulfitobacterium sp.]|uniref:hypothetical protein n=1 Tax=Desulfitobacterium sp. TaxID=49981 RepID=UPI002B1F3524|nr:hypothetical protein [Desulfitobacterium sp.]MEA4902099.1 hypothetical protein [Desulfitobacterium sp.]